MSTAVFNPLRHRFGLFLRSNISPAARLCFKTKSALLDSQVGTVGKIGTPYDIVGLRHAGPTVPTAPTSFAIQTALTRM
jgi:hypothetical protein